MDPSSRHGNDNDNDAAAAVENAINESSNETVAVSAENQSWPTVSEPIDDDPSIKIAQAKDGLPSDDTSATQPQEPPPSCDTNIEDTTTQAETSNSTSNTTAKTRGEKRPLERSSSFHRRGWEVAWINNSANAATKKTAKVALLEKHATVSIAGRGSVCCRQGIVTGHGFLLQPNQWYPFECPKWSSWLVLETDTDTAQIDVRERAMGEAPDNNNNTTHDDTTTINAPQHGPSLPPHLEQDTAVDDANFPATFSLHNTSSPTSRPTLVMPEWPAAAQCIVENDSAEKQQQQPKNNIIVVAGAKGVGKSTFVRYLVHCFLSKGQAVYVLDGDTGQAEFGPPGLLTLTYLPASSRGDDDIVYPLWSLPHHHMVSTATSNCNPLVPRGATQEAIFFGGISSELDPARYLQSMTQLMERYHANKNTTTTACPKSKTAVPLIVNLDGWVKGLGYQVLSTFLTTHQPAHVVEIVGTNATQQVDVSPILEQHQQGNSITRIHTLPSYRKRAAVDSNISPALSVPSSAWRNLRFVHYWLDDPTFEVDFSQHDLIRDDAQVIAQQLAGQSPYMVPWESVSCQSLAGVKLSPLAINGRIVGLCQDAADSTELSNCVGLGVIRSVDTIKRLFYILTPVLSTVLPSVRLLVLGKLSLPLECVFLGARGASFPYQMETSTAKEIIGSAPMQSRKNILRKGMNT